MEISVKKLSIGYFIFYNQNKHRKDLGSQIQLSNQVYLFYLIDV